jgi:hypothetical protein
LEDIMQSINAWRGFPARRCSHSEGQYPPRPRILLIARTAAGASTHAEILEQAGFDVEFIRESADAAEICSRRNHRVRAIVLVETGSGTQSSASDLVARLSEVSPSVPCVLIPVDASPTNTEVAIRMAIRWGSLAYLTGSRLH